MDHKNTINPMALVKETQMSTREKLKIVFKSIFSLNFIKSLGIIICLLSI